MLALGLGLLAALSWAVHDLLVRRLSQDAAILPMMLVVVAVGGAILAVPALVFGDWSGMTVTAGGFAAASGLAYVLGMVGLYSAFRLAPVRIVAPVLGSYPVLSLGIAMAQGRSVAPIEWVAVGMVVLGVGLVAMTGQGPAEAQPVRTLPAIGLAAAGAVGFALTFAFGQEAARLSAELPAILIGRAVALAVLGGAAVALRAPVASVRPTLPTLAGMGALDAAALGLVLSASTLPSPEYAAIAAALFGVFTVLLARPVLGERVTPTQWVAVGTVFAGISILSAQ